MLKKKSNKLIAILLSVLLSGVVPATVTLADILIGDADGILVVNKGGNFPDDNLTYNDSFTSQYELKPGESKSFPLSLGIVKKLPDYNSNIGNVVFPVTGTASVSTNPGGATLDKTTWIIEKYDLNTTGNFNLNIIAPNTPGLYTYIVTFMADSDLDKLVSSTATATLHVNVVAPVSPDTTKPEFTYKLTPSAPDGMNGWYTSPVTVEFIYSDEVGGSGIDSLTEPQAYTLSDDGIHKSKEVTIKDKAGNETSVTIPEIKIDQTVPTLTHTLDPAYPNGNNGWYTSPVTVKFIPVDNLSGIDPDSLTGDYIISTDGTTPANSYTVKDMAGNESIKTTVPEIKLDSTKPSITINIPEEKAVYKLKEVVNVDWNATDATSDIDFTKTFADSTVLDTSSVGTKTFTVFATDNAGNFDTKTVEYTVIYDFAGFFKPINMDGLNSTKAGSSIPIKFSLSGDQGMDILKGTPKTIALNVDPNSDEATPVDIMTAGKSGLSYDPLTEQYTYVWKTDKSWTGKSKALVVTLTDGEEYRVNFTFK